MFYYVDLECSISLDNNFQKFSSKENVDNEFPYHCSYTVTISNYTIPK